VFVLVLSIAIGTIVPRAMSPHPPITGYFYHFIQSDFPRYGDNVLNDMSRHKASQLANTAHVLASKPSYEGAALRYWYLCPSAPSQRTQDELLIPMQNMRGSRSFG
jgi:hypothetical protein